MRIQHTVSAFQAIFVRASESGQAARDKDKDKDLRDNIADVLDGGQLVNPSSHECNNRGN
jgi:hypothetical protein